MRAVHLTIACFFALAACGEETERLEGLVDTCLGREAELRRDVGTCNEDLEEAQSAATGEGIQRPTDAPPLMPMRARVRSRPGAVPELEFDARSYTQHKTVHRVHFRARIFNAFEELIPCRPADPEIVSTCFAGADELRDDEEQTIEPRRSERIRRELPDHPGASRAIVTIHHVVFKDHSTWTGSAVGFPAPPIRRNRDDEDDEEGGRRSGILDSLRARD